MVEHLYRNTSEDFLYNLLTDKQVKSKGKKFVSLSLDRNSGGMDHYGDVLIYFNAKEIFKNGGIEIDYEDSKFWERHPDIARHVTGYTKAEFDKEFEDGDQDEDFMSHAFIYQDEQEVVIPKLKMSDTLIDKVEFQHDIQNKKLEEKLKEYNIDYKVTHTKSSGEIVKEKKLTESKNMPRKFLLTESYFKEAVDLASAVYDFLKNNPNPKDKELHTWAEKEGLDVHEVESEIYKLATKFVQHGKEEINEAMKNIDKIKNSLGEKLFDYIGSLDEEGLKKQLKELQQEIKRLEASGEKHQINELLPKYKDEEWLLKYRLQIPDNMNEAKFDEKKYSELWDRSKKDGTAKGLPEYEDYIKKNFGGNLSPHIENAFKETKTKDQFIKYVKSFHLDESMNEAKFDVNKTILAFLDERHMGHATEAKKIMKTLKDKLGDKFYDTLLKHGDPDVDGHDVVRKKWLNDAMKENPTNEEVIKEAKEYVIWGTPKGSNEDTLLLTAVEGKAITDKKDAEYYKKHIEDKFGATKTRIQEIDLGKTFNFVKEIGLKESSNFDKATKEVNSPDIVEDEYKLIDNSKYKEKNGTKYTHEMIITDGEYTFRNMIAPTGKQLEISQKLKDGSSELLNVNKLDDKADRFFKNVLNYKNENGIELISYEDFKKTFTESFTEYLKKKMFLKEEGEGFPYPTENDSEPQPKEELASSTDREIRGERSDTYSGKANEMGVTEKDVDKKELEKGIEVESEHTSDPIKAKQIALDHLAESGKWNKDKTKFTHKKYYSELKKMEKKLEKKK